MCELLGMCFTVPVNPKVSFRGFRHRGERNPDGWGLGLYPDGKAAQIIKEPIEAGSSVLADFIKEYPLSSRIFIGHVRSASRGDVTYSNTHPFVRELGGKEYVFAHNGTISVKFETRRFKPLGETDSENAFCYLLEKIFEKDIRNWRDEEFDWLRNKLEEINGHGSINCLLSDGEHLFCYANNGFPALNFTCRTPPYGRLRLMDEDWDINLEELKDPNEKGYIVATHPLTDEQWLSFLPGELIVFKNGIMVYSSHREALKDEEGVLSNTELAILKVLRNSPQRVSHREIREKLKDEMSHVELKYALRSLLAKEYIKQDRRDSVKWDQDSATFYTTPEKRVDVDRILKKLASASDE